MTEFFAKHFPYDEKPWFAYFFTVRVKFYYKIRAGLNPKGFKFGSSIVYGGYNLWKETNGSINYIV